MHFVMKKGGGGGFALSRRHKLNLLLSNPILQGVLHGIPLDLFLHA